MTELKWYFTSLVVASREVGGQFLARLYHCLLTAINHDEAYDKAMRLGRRLEDQEYEYKGIGKLLLVHETPKDGAEILWSQEEMSPRDFEALLRDAKVNREASASSRSGWYLGSVVLCEVHDEGSHGDRVLVWINSYLIEAMTFEGAYEKAGQLGAEQQDEPGSHLCDGQKAHWEFKGIQDVIPLHDAPGDTALLWSEELTATAPELERLIPNKSDLGVFEWEEEQLNRE
jgi:hypothetical protein